MESDLEPPTATTTTTTVTTTTTTTGNHSLSPPISYYDNDSNCSTPYVSAPSSPGRTFSRVGVGFFYSAPASPMHFILSTSPATISLAPATSDASSSASFEFEFSSRFDSPARDIAPSMSSADELFLNGQIRPMKLSAHLQRPQTLAPLISDNEDDDDDDDGDVFKRRRDLRLRDRSQRRRTRSLSPLRNTTPFDWLASDDTVSAPKKEEIDRKEEEKNETTPSGSASSSRCSSAGRSSKRWVFLKDFLRSKSEGRSNNKFWQNISFSPAKEKKAGREKGRNNNNNNNDDKTTSYLSEEKEKMMKMRRRSLVTGAKSVKRRSAHEMHYTANRAQAEEMRKKTFLPYRQGLLGCLGFNSKSYGALNGFARALNPVSSR